MNDRLSDNAGVIAIPPIIYVIGILLGLLIHYLHPIRLLPELASVPLAVLLLLVSIPIALAAVWAMNRAKTTIDVRKSTTAIATDGIFQFSRNPMYLSLTLLYLAIAAWVNSVWIVLLVIPVLVVMYQGVIKREEHYLEKKFGDEYLKYKSKVRRWI